VKQWTFLFVAPVPPTFDSTFSGALTATSPTFTRKDATGVFFYQTIRITAPTTGVYTIRSSSAAIDIYGYLYQSSFNPGSVLDNYLTYDDDSDGSLQFRIVWSIQTGNTYILVVTTHAQNMLAPFAITVSGPARVTMSN
jgi:hypothetical protein